MRPTIADSTSIYTARMLQFLKLIAEAEQVISDLEELD